MAQRGKASRSIASDGGAEADSAEPIAAERAHEDLAHDIKNGAKWSMFGNIITRAGSLLVGILVANIVGSVGVGVFAIALTVGQMLLTLIDMGLGTDLIRGTNEEMERKAPTIASLGMIFCTIGALFLVVFAAPIAHVMGSDAATPLMRVYAIMVFIGGLAIVPQGILMRTMDQRSLFFATVSNFIVGNGLTLGLLLGTDIGVLALPIGAAVGMAIEVTMFYVFTKRRLHFGWDRTIMRSTLSFGVPVAGSNVLQVLLGNVDRMLIGATLGERRLGHYAMASNVAQWPVSVFGLVVRTVAMPAFARTKPTANDPVLTLGAQLTWLISLPVGVMLALLSHDVIYFLYGEEFGPAVPLLTTLAIYGAIRVMFDTFTGFLYARSNSRGVLTANIIWVVALIGMTWIGARRFGLEGAAWHRSSPSSASRCPPSCTPSTRPGAACATSPAVWFPARWPASRPAPPASPSRSSSTASTSRATTASTPSSASPWAAWSSSRSTCRWSTRRSAPAWPRCAPTEPSPRWPSPDRSPLHDSAPADSTGALPFPRPGPGRTGRQ